MTKPIIGHVGQIHHEERMSVGKTVNCKRLQTPGVEVNIKTRYGVTPIMSAVWYCNKEAVEVMLRDGRVELRERLEEEVGGSGLRKREIVRLIQEERSRRDERNISGGGRRSGKPRNCS